MNFILRILLIYLLSYYLGFVNFWWIIVIYSIIIGYIFIDNLTSHFISGFLGVSLAWISLVFEIDFQSASILSNKITKLASLDNNIFLIIITSLMGGFLGGLGSIFGQSVRKIFIKKENQDPYLD